MRLSWTLSRYIAQQFIASVGMVFLAVISLVYLVDLVEGMRKYGGRESVEFSIIVTMSFLKLPGLAEQVLPFTVLFGGMWTFTRLTRSHELVVARAAGVSVWQFLTPPLAIGLIAGLVLVTLFNPMAAAMNQQFERLHVRHTSGGTSQLSISRTGLWLREGTEAGQLVIHALKVSDQGVRLDDVIIFEYDPDDRLIGRIDAKSAALTVGFWEIRHAWASPVGQPPVYREQIKLATNLLIEDVEENFAAPNTMSFWELPRFIQIAESAGFSATRHRLHWHTILSTPLLIFAMILIAATFSLRFSRLGGIGQLVAAGVLTGFALYFISDLAEALGLSGNLPVALAAWAPTGVATLLGTTMLFHLEDG